jgi:hypothetical protein
LAADAARGCLALWDGAHKLQLAAHDMREDKVGTVALYNVEWYNIMLRELSEILEGITWGKGLEELKRMASEAQQRLLTAKRFCPGRFVGSEVEVYNSFLRNYAVMVKYFKAHSTIPDAAKRCKRNVDEQKMHDKLEKLTNFSFVSEILIARDISLRLRQTSLILQDGKGLEWENVEEALSLIAELQAAASAADARDAPVGRGDACFPPDESKPGARLLPALFKLLHGGDDDERCNSGSGAMQTILTQLYGEGKYRGVQLLRPFIDPKKPSLGRHTWASAYRVAVDEAHDAVAALAHFLEVRFVHNKGAPRQVTGEKPGHSMVDEEGTAASKMIALMADCLDFRKLITVAATSGIPPSPPRPTAAATATRRPLSQAALRHAMRHALRSPPSTPGRRR